jgi:very-short-patch-repair endonuclease
VYLLAHEAEAKYADEMAAVLACRPRSLINRHTGAYMWGFRPKPIDGIVDITVVGRKARSRAGIRVHRTATMVKAELCFINNIPVASPARVLLEIAPDLGERELELAVHEAIALKVVTITEIRGVVRRHPRRPGSARLRALADPKQPTTVTDSKAAERLFSHLRRSGLPQPLVDHPIKRWRPDFFWPQARLAVEVDGGDFHSSRPRIERDHRKDAELKSDRIEVLRFTGRQIYREIEFVLVAIAREYERRVAAAG